LVSKILAQVGMCRTVRAGDRQYGYEILEKGAVGVSAEENLKLMLHDARNSSDWGMGCGRERHQSKRDPWQRKRGGDDRWKSALLPIPSRIPLL